jgi:CheY-like chemotaxis protein
LSTHICRDNFFGNKKFAKSADNSTGPKLMCYGGPQAHSAERRLPMSDERILVVEDEQQVAQYIERTLISFGFIVVSSTDCGDRAVHDASSLRPDLVLMDIHLKGIMDGIEAARQIRSRLDVPVVFLTSLRDECTFLRAKSVAPFGYILKPFSSCDLRNAIEIALFQHHCNQLRAISAVKEAEEKCRAVYQNAAAGVVAEALKGKSAELDPVLLGILGCRSREELIAKAAPSTQSPRPIAETSCLPANPQEQLPQLPQLKLLTYGSDGSTLWISEYKRLLRKGCSEHKCGEGSFSCAEMEANGTHE